MASAPRLWDVPGGQEVNTINGASAFSFHSLHPVPYASPPVTNLESKMVASRPHLQDLGGGVPHLRQDRDSEVQASKELRFHLRCCRGSGTGTGALSYQRCNNPRTETSASAAPCCNCALPYMEPIFFLAGFELKSPVSASSVCQRWKNTLLFRLWGIGMFV